MKCAIISKGANLQHRDLEDNTLLHTASVYDHQNLVEFLVTRAPEFINEENRDGYTPLHSAAEQGHLSIVQYLISKGAELNTKDGEGNTLLHTACIHRHQELVELLVTHSPGLANERNIYDYTPLHFAVEQGHPGIVEHLISKGAAAINVNGLTPLDIAILSDQKEIALFLSSKPDFNSCSRENRIKLNEFQFQNIQQEIIISNSGESSVSNSTSLEGRDEVSYSDTSISSPVVSSTFGSLSDINTSDITPMRTSDMSTSAWNEMLADVADLLDRPNSSLNGCNEIVQQSKRQRTC